VGDAQSGQEDPCTEIFSGYKTGDVKTGGVLRGGGTEVCLEIEGRGWEGCPTR